MPVDDSPNHCCSQRNVINFFSIAEFNRLGLPILSIMVQSPLLYFFFQVLTVVLIKEHFGYYVVSFLIAETVPKVRQLLTGQLPSESSQELRLDIFSGARMSFGSPFQQK